MNLEGFSSQTYPLVCPECGYDMFIAGPIKNNKHFLGEGEYPHLSMTFSVMSYNKPKFGYGFECSKCFIKSVCHKKEE